MSEQPVSERIKILLDRYTYGNKAAMGRSLGISGQAIADLIEGKKGGPSFSVLQKMLTLYSEIRAEWLIFGEEPMLKAKVELASNDVPVISSVDNDGRAVQTVVGLNDEQVSRIFQAAYSSLVGSEQIREEAASIRAKAEAQVNMLTNIYWIGEPSPNRPYKGLLTERLNISEEEARELVTTGKIRSVYPSRGKQRRITGYRIGEQAVLEFLNSSGA